MKKADSLRMKIKAEAEAQIRELHGARGYMAEVAERVEPPVTRGYVHRWFRTDMVNAKIEKAAIAYLEELKKNAQAKLEKIKS